MKNFIYLFITFVVLDLFWNINGSAVGDPAPGRSPGPPDIQENLDSNKIAVNINSNCDLQGTFKDVDHDNGLNFTIDHSVFKTAELVPGITYQGECYISLYFVSLNKPSLSRFKAQMFMSM